MLPVFGLWSHLFPEQCPSNCLGFLQAAPLARQFYPRSPSDAELSRLLILHFYACSKGLLKRPILLVHTLSSSYHCGFNNSLPSIYSAVMVNSTSATSSISNSDLENSMMGLADNLALALILSVLVSMTVNGWFTWAL